MTNNENTENLLEKEKQKPEKSKKRNLFIISGILLLIILIVTWFLLSNKNISHNSSDYSFDVLKEYNDEIYIDNLNEINTISIIDSDNNIKETLETLPEKSEIFPEQTAFFIHNNKIYIMEGYYSNYESKINIIDLETKEVDNLVNFGVDHLVLNCLFLNNYIYGVVADTNNNTGSIVKIDLNGNTEEIYQIQDTSKFNSLLTNGDNLYLITNYYDEQNDNNTFFIDFIDLNSYEVHRITALENNSNYISEIYDNTLIITHYNSTELTEIDLETEETSIVYAKDNFNENCIGLLNEEVIFVNYNYYDVYDSVIENGYYTLENLNFKNFNLNTLTSNNLFDFDPREVTKSDTLDNYMTMKMLKGLNNYYLRLEFSNDQGQHFTWISYETNSNEVKILSDFAYNQ